MPQIAALTTLRRFWGSLPGYCVWRVGFEILYICEPGLIGGLRMRRTFSDRFCCRPFWLVSAIAVALIVPPITYAPPVDWDKPIAREASDQPPKQPATSADNSVH
jgi:hypothetical protein